mmetsp:Transcript_5214/g.8893  ORF Transcript_5214/g.8893 Transcript_5214/m.8893 type:complete len:247 (-) Transcript_5214:191-931(-)
MLVVLHLGLSASLERRLLYLALGHPGSIRDGHGFPFGHLLLRSGHHSQTRGGDCHEDSQAAAGAAGLRFALYGLRSPGWQGRGRKAARGVDQSWVSLVPDVQNHQATTLLPLPGLRQLRDAVRSSLSLRQQLCWPAELSLLLRLRHIGLMFGDDGAARAVLVSEQRELRVGGGRHDSCEQRRLAAGLLRTHCAWRPGGDRKSPFLRPMGLPRLSDCNQEDHQGVSTESGEHCGGAHPLRIARTSIV